MGHVLVEFPELIRDETGRVYRARACGVETESRLWHGWIEFEPTDGGETIRSGRETTQPNEVDTRYWASGLTTVYLEGALHRALHPPLPRTPASPRPSTFDGPADPRDVAPPAAEAVLNPFSVIDKGETLLRRQLGALSAWHLVNIVRAYQIPTGETDPLEMPASSLVEAIVADARRRRIPAR